MRTLSFLLFLALAHVGGAQNVGVGKANPTERLDVNGNVNVDGKLKINGNAGQPGQTLMVQPDGTQKWINSFGYKNRRTISFANTWTVPASVTEIMLEVIAGGGGGAKGGGGGAGGYVIARVKVAPGAVITATIVSGDGFPAFTENATATNGETVQVSTTGLNIMSYGGNAATPSAPGQGQDGVASGDSLMYSMVLAGAPGSPLVETYSQRSATEYVTMRKQGDGGACMFDPHCIAKGGFFSFNTATLANITLVGSTSGTVCLGAGGAGGNTTGFTTAWGGFGGNPRVFVSY